jgi:hypothetical protein
MKKHLSLLLPAFISLAASAFPSQDAKPSFDWSLLKGVWAESTRHQFGCRSGNLHQRLSASEDRKTITFKNDRKWRIGSGEEVEEYSASIVRSLPNVLVIRYNREISGIPEALREWEMRFIGPGTYRWRATSWPEGVFNDVIGVKCSAQ